MTRGEEAILFEHFIAAQQPVYATALAELRAGDKATHWMWFIFPQLRALGRSPMARRFGLDGVADAAAFLAHPVLGPRYRECVAAVLGVEGRTAHEIFHSPDDLKFRSSLTLFGRAAPEEELFGAALQRYYGGIADPLTLDLLPR